MKTLIVLFALCGPVVAHAQTVITWSSSNCYSCDSTILSKFPDQTGTGLFLENIEIGNDIAVGVGVMRAYSNFVVAYIAKENISEADIRNGSVIELTAKDKTTLYPENPDKRIPKELREQKLKKVKGYFGGYLFFPYDDDANDLAFVLKLKTATLTFPFARKAAPAQMSFGDPAVVEAQSSEPVIMVPTRPTDASNLSHLTTGCEQAIETHISGDFKGWEGETIYKMDNGQIWQQSRYHYHYHYAFHPVVIIFESASGACRIKVDGDEDSDVDVIQIH